MNYYDPANNSPLDVFQDMKVEWLQGERLLAACWSRLIFNPPSADTEYALRVYNRFGCETTASLTYDIDSSEGKLHCRSNGRRSAING
jgi:hypothetical protein